MQGGTIATLSGLVYTWAEIFQWTDSLVTAVCATLGALGSLWALYGLRRATTHQPKKVIADIADTMPKVGILILCSVAFIWLGPLGCRHACDVPQLAASAHTDGLPNPAGNLKLRCGQKTMDVDVRWAPKSALACFKKCMTPPNGWKAGDALPAGWACKCGQ